MSQRITTTGTAQPRIRATGNGQPHIDHAQVAAALGAEPVEGNIQGNPGVVALYALRSELLRCRQSNGGRPGIAGTSQRLKIPLSDQDWTELEGLADQLSEEGFAPSAGQIASVLLHAAIQSVKEQSGGKQDEQKLVEAIARRLVASGAADQRK
jgi:hypothetical protein